ncbi:hypothetical protein [Methanoregula sp.]|uniref:hypothetical protein n=1 Tax=Methanoregula sp. TaxID=2052170 RepID=UPI002BD87914|nr:hypothetical protein [Methanoregula sp.]HVP96027.1 hypothetical protein [Methanoregula sp.]
MQRSLFLILSLLACAFLLGAGCTSTTPSPASTTPAATIALAPLALTPADIPAGFTLQSAREKSPDEMSSMAKDLGWQEGYVASWTTPANGTAGSTVITQTITVYTAENQSSLVSLVASNEQQQAGLAFSDLPLPATGPDTHALSAAVVNATPASTPAGGFGPLQSGSASTAPTQGYIEVIFAKGPVLEVVRMTGPGADYATLKTLAETAYAKLG